MTYFSNVVVNQDRKYSRSYGSPELVKYAYAIEEGEWVELFNELGYSKGRKKTTAKHFHDFSGKEITKRTFEMRTRKALKIRQEQREMETKQNKIDTEKREKEYKEFVTNLKLTLKPRIQEVSEKIKEIVTEEDITNRLNKNMETNEICNRAVGFVGYEFAKGLGWMFVLTMIKKEIY